MKKNGFTLIELLAVIIVLGVLLGLVIPKIKDSYNDAKLNIHLNSAKSLVKSFDEYYARKNIYNNFSGCTYNFTNDSNNCADFSFSGKKPTKGSISINNVGYVSGFIKFDDFGFKINGDSIEPYDYNIELGKEYVFVCNSSTNSLIIEQDGYYKLEVWGAQGGSYSSTLIGGYGGYSVGEIFLKENQEIFFNVGCAGVVNNGIADGMHNAGTGGGASYITLSSGILSSFSNNLSDIIIVAGGGGSANYHTNGYYGSGGHGGGYIGSSGTNDGRNSRLVPTGGTQEAGGNGDVNGSFGQGGVKSTYSSGGDGFYGGGAAGASTNNYGLCGTGGGSGYIGNPLLLNKAMYCYDCMISSDVDTLTYSVSDVSTDAISGYAKKSDGYIKITYLGDDE